MLRMLTIYLLVSIYTFRATGQETIKASTVTNVQLKSLPNPLIVPWGNTKYYCTRSDAWVTADWAPTDCAGAIQKFHDIEVIPKGSTVYEFIQDGAQQNHPSYYGQATPRQYTYGNCTMGIVNMNDTGLGTLVPARFTDIHGYTDDDFSTYTDIWDAATELYRICTVSYGAPGWLSVGDEMSTGVFLYASNSTIDEQINGTEPDTRISDHMPDGWNYLGCNYDSSNRSLKDLSWSGENLSVERCAAYCAGKRYFGVEYGRECYCGNTINTYSAIGGASACNMPCNGIETEICGGISAMSVYQRNST